MLLGRRIDFERRMSRFPPVTASLIGVLGAVFALEVAVGAPGSREALVSAGALARDPVLAGEYWRLVTATLLHGSLDHFLGNAIALYILGMICEHAFGARQFVILYVLSALAGSLLSLALSAGPSVGASGAIFGLQGAAIVLFYKYRRELLLRDKRIGVVLLAWAIYSVLSGAVTPYIDNGAHLGGALGGALVAAALHPAVLRRRPPDGHEAGVLGLLGLVALVVGYAVVAGLVL